MVRFSWIVHHFYIFFLPTLFLIGYQGLDQEDRRVLQAAVEQMKTTSIKENDPDDFLKRISDSLNSVNFLEEVVKTLSDASTEWKKEFIEKFLECCSSEKNPKNRYSVIKNRS